jgi:hypothetical protein
MVPAIRSFAPATTSRIRAGYRMISLRAISIHAANKQPLVNNDALPISQQTRFELSNVRQAQRPVGMRRWAFYDKSLPAERFERPQVPTVEVLRDAAWV